MKDRHVLVQQPRLLGRLGRDWQVPLTNGGRTPALPVDAGAVAKF